MLKLSDWVDINKLIVSEIRNCTKNNLNIEQFKFYIFMKIKK